MRSFPRPRRSHRSSSATAERTEHHPVTLQQLRKPLTNLSLKPCWRHIARLFWGNEWGGQRAKGAGSVQCLFPVQRIPLLFLFTAPLAVLTLSTAKTCFPPMSSVSRCLHACVAPQANTLASFRLGPSIYRRAAAATELLAPRQTAALYLCSK